MLVGYVKNKYVYCITENLSRRDAEMLQEMEKFATDAAATATSTVGDSLDEALSEDKVRL